MLVSNLPYPYKLPRVDQLVNIQMPVPKQSIS
jgi:hypothetical protein